MYPIAREQAFSLTASGVDWYTPVFNNFDKVDQLYCIEGKGLDVFLLRDFISAQECKHLIGLIEQVNFPSRLMGPAEQNFRTSHSSPLSNSRDPLVRAIERRIADLTGIPLRNQEGMEGQRYNAGQEFKPHFDAFLPDHDYYPVELAAGGQRTWTVMIALNQPEAGGGTLFPTAGLRITPRAGNLIAWSSLTKNGSVNPASLHCGEPVEAGQKYIVTKWHRERLFCPEGKAAKIAELKKLGLLRDEWVEDAPPVLARWGQEDMRSHVASEVAGVPN